MKNKILLVVHQATSNPGRVGRIVELFGHVPVICTPACGDVLPECLEDYAGVVIFGGPMSANDDDSLACIRAELDWIAKPLAQKVPFLGICLGAQLLARHLGATVGPSVGSYQEIGYYPVRATEAGRDIFAPEQHFYQWHGEGFELPHGAELLATGDAFPNQAFRYETAHAIQFHPEVTRDMMSRWSAFAAHRLVLAGAQPRESHLNGHRQYDADVESWIRQFFCHWLDLPGHAVQVAAQAAVQAAE
jgi:GMP synthase (glutamine-hydrolysing)